MGDSMPQTSLDDLREELDTLQALGVTAEYAAKQLHRLPVAPVVDRVLYILECCQGKRVMHLGCGWPPGMLHVALSQVAALNVGVDIAIPEDECSEVFARRDLDFSPVTLPWNRDPEVVVVAEILEHLANPGMLLHEIREGTARTQESVIITVPNAYSSVARRHVTGGMENVHRQHVAWYSYKTLHTLVTRYGFTLVEMAWYNCPHGAQPQESEGLIFQLR